LTLTRYFGLRSVNVGDFSSSILELACSGFSFLLMVLWVNLDLWLSDTIWGAKARETDWVVRKYFLFIYVYKPLLEVYMRMGWGMLIFIAVVVNELADRISLGLLVTASNLALKPQFLGKIKCRLEPLLKLRILIT